MRLRLIFIVGVITGYILGARAGRARYEKIKATATDAWEDPRVQKAVADTEEFIEKNAPIVAEKLSEGAKVAADRIADAARIAGTSITEGAKVVADAAARLTEGVKPGDASTKDESTASDPDLTIDSEYRA